jgi:hypothetical protein
VEAIEKVFSNLQLDERYPEYLNVSRNEELARQFLWIHSNKEKTK